MLHRARNALEPAHRAQADVEIEFLAQRDVQRADAAADRRGQRALDATRYSRTASSVSSGSQTFVAVDGSISRRHKSPSMRSCACAAVGLSTTAASTALYKRDDRGDRITGVMSTPMPSPSMNGNDEDQLARALFPLGELHKTEVRRLAREAGLPNHARKDSTGICFIGERRFREFLGRYLPAQPGEVRTVDGRRVGRHDGLMFHTIGQRKGLGIGGRNDGSGEPWYVVAKDLRDNALIVGQGCDHPLLYSDVLIAGRLHWIAGVPPAWPLGCQAKIRYRQEDQACVVEPDGEGRVAVTFERPQRAIAPGQSVVFYRGEECLGGGIIETASGPCDRSRRGHRCSGWAALMARMIRDATLALAGVFQSVYLVREIAHHGSVPSNLLEVSIRSLFEMDPPDTESVYGGRSELHIGLKLLKDQIGGDTKKADIEITKYVVSLLHLERKLVRNQALMGRLKEGISRSSAPPTTTSRRSSTSSRSASRRPGARAGAEFIHFACTSEDINNLATR
jgi:hypothetical protein